ncbi:uncharacterized protein LOC115326177 [Ixodes scapularis]|nr:uncharacterized protein LOC115326177 [Ixodes scapularis]
MVEWNMSRSYGWQPRGFKLDIWRILPDDDAQQLPVRSMVLPLGESYASLTDLEPRLEYRITLCPMEGAQSGCKTVLLPSRTAALEGNQPKKAQIDTLKPVSEGSPRPSPAIMVIRIMGCCVVLILTGFTLIVFLTSGTAYPDVVAQIFSEFSIMGAYTCVLMTTTDQRQLTEKQCMVAAVCLQFFFLSTFLFLMLESAYMAKLLVGMFPESLPFNSASVSGAGWGVPAIITGLFAWAFPDKYTRGGQVCWLDLSQVASYSTTVPVGLFVALQLVFLASVFFSARRRRALTCHEFRRARTQLASKWASLILLASTTLSWATGAAAEQHKTRGLFVCFSVSSIMLGVFVITLRISTEDQVRKKLMTKVGLTTAVRDISSGSSVQTWSRSSPTESDASRANTASTLTSPADSYQNVKIFRN